MCDSEEKARGGKRALEACNDDEKTLAPKRTPLELEDIFTPDVVVMDDERDGDECSNDRDDVVIPRALNAAKRTAVKTFSKKQPLSMTAGPTSVNCLLFERRLGRTLSKG